MRIALTGGTGFVGSHLATQLRATGNTVVLLSRAGVQDPGVRFWSLEREPDPELLQGFDLLIHCAWDLTATDERNISGSRRLFDAARKAAIPRMIFVSSLSAFEGCRSRYGQTKLEVEAIGAKVGVHNIRLGFVWDGSERGLSGGLKKLARLPIVPLPGTGHQRLFAIYAGDLANSFLRAVETSRAETIHMAHSTPVTLERMLRHFGREHGRVPLLLPVPWRLLWLPLRCAEAAGAKGRFRSDSLVSLMNQNRAPDFRAIADLGICLRPFPGNESEK